MERLNRLTEVLAEIEELSERMIRTALPIMRTVINDKDRIVSKIKKLLDEKTPKTDTEIKETLQSHSLTLVQDAKTIKKELPLFIECIIRNDPVQDAANFTLLREFWCGDMYDEQGIDALERLASELKVQIERCTLDEIVKTVASAE